MDEAIADELAEPVDGTCIRHKENRFSLKPGSSNMLQSNEMVTPGIDDFSEKSKNVYSVTLDTKDIDRIGSSEHASASPRCMDNAGVMVEELTLRNYDGEKLSIVGNSNNRDRMQNKRNQWQNLYQIAGGSGMSHGQTGYKGKGQATSSVWEDGGNNFFPGLLDQPLSNYNHNAIMENLLPNDDQGTAGDTLYSSGGIRTKIISKSGFSEYFIKSTLRDKGVIHKTHASRGSGIESGDQGHHPKSSIAGLTAAVAPLGFTAKPVSPISDGVSEPWSTLGSRNISDGISIREWLEAGGKKATKVEKIRIFRQVLDLVDLSHSHGVSLQDLRPSSFKLSGSYQVTYLGSSVRVGPVGVTENVMDQDVYQSNHSRTEKRPINRSMLPLGSHSEKKQKLGEKSNFIQRWPQFPSRSGARSVSINVAKDSSNDIGDEHNPRTEIKNHNKLFGDFGHTVPNSSQTLHASVNFMLEVKWYTSPEQLNEKACTFTSNIYCLGVLLFELLGSFDSGRSHAAAMLDLRHRILPPSFLSENPKEAGLCLWLLHPEPSLRATTREILQFLCGTQELSGGESLSAIEEEDEDSELLFHFLSSVQEQKQKNASNLMEQIQCIEADIQEVEKRRPKRSLVPSSSPKESPIARGSTYAQGGNATFDAISSPSSDADTRLMTNIRQLENAYFSMRSNYQLSDSHVATQRDGELLKSRQNWCSMGKEERYNPEDRLGGFFDGLCKYARYSKFKVRGVLQNGEFSNSANVICSLSFDRDGDYLASGGVSKKIKIFEFQALFDDSVDIHYPAVEMSNKSKLSCICWNSYIRNFLASTDYDGIVKLWDATTGQGVSQFSEHSQRAWSVDFSRVDPTKLVSGSDDRLVKLWSINDKNSLCTIRNNANVCCVQFSSHNTHLLAFSSADYKTYCYDLRNVSIPWCILAGHEKAVSYAKFLDAGTLVTASTDNTLKIWDLKKTSSNCVSRDACILTLRGHTNEKNFVGLSVSDGYITCGSETNEVFAYHRSMPMPVTSYKFGSIDPITGKETEDDNGQFVSSVCWRPNSNMVVSANSSGCIKLLEMV